jgi:hypothetical protein
MRPIITQEDVERAARIYRSTTDAARALGIGTRSFGRLLRKYDIKPRWKPFTKAHDEY